MRDANEHAQLYPHYGATQVRRVASNLRLLGPRQQSVHFVHFVYFFYSLYSSRNAILIRGPVMHHRVMIEKQNTNRRYNWTETPRNARESRWSKLYVSINPQGKIAISKFTHESMGSPGSYLLLYDADLNVVGLQPARLAVTKNAYPVLHKGYQGGFRIFAHRLMREHSLYLSETVYFPRCFIDGSGTLILELNDVRPARKDRRGY